MAMGSKAVMFEANLWVEGRQGKHVKDYRLLCDVISGSECSHSACQRSRSLVKNAVAGGSASAGVIFNRQLGFRVGISFWTY